MLLSDSTARAKRLMLLSSTGLGDTVGRSCQRAITARSGGPAHSGAATAPYRVNSAPPPSGLLPGAAPRGRHAGATATRAPSR